MDSLPSTSKNNKRKRTNNHANKNQSTEKNRPLTTSELEEEAIKYTEGDSDSSADYFNDSGSEWDGDSEESSRSEDDLSEVEEYNTVIEATNDNSMLAVANNNWFEVDCSHLRWDIIFSEVPGYNDKIKDYPKNKNELTPVQVYSALLDDEIFELLVRETNRNAEQQKNNKIHTRHARIQRWKPTNKEEMRKFLAIILYMGLVKYPKIADYWNQSILYKNAFVPNLMGRNRFQLLLRYIHFSNNETAQPNDRLHKIQDIFTMMEARFAANCVPGEVLVVDESMVPFRGRLLFRQYIPSKRHKYGLKMFKLCDTTGYTFRMLLYSGKNFQDVSQGLGEKVVMELCDKYLDAGRTVVTDNYYTSVPLAIKLLDRNTHLLGTLRKNRKGLPEEVTKAKLTKGEIVGKESEAGFVVGKWMDKREVCFLSTKHGIDIKSTGKKNRNNEEILKPNAIIDYNCGKDGVDISDQMASYFSPLRKTIRWYHKAVFELLLNTSVVNAWIIWKNLSKKTMQITEFREQLILGLVGVPSRIQNTTDIEKHKLVEEQNKTSQNRKKRNRCSGCYQKIKEKQGRDIAQKTTKLVYTKCDKCATFLCLSCFTEKH